MRLGLPCRRGAFCMCLVKLLQLAHAVVEAAEFRCVAAVLIRLDRAVVVDQVVPEVAVESEGLIRSGRGEGPERARMASRCTQENVEVWVECVKE
eukprot:3774251-Pleurochrysis_carterae.AAC.2